MATPGFGKSGGTAAGPGGAGDRLRAAAETLARIDRDHSPAVFACSFSMEDCVLLDLLAVHAPRVEVVTFDTGRLPQETHDLIAAYAARGAAVRVLVPEAAAIEAWVARHGSNGFRQSLQARQSCCELRKVRPLDRALAGKRAWITGLRRAQSGDRQALPAEDFDAARGIRKFNPLVEWSDAEVRRYAADRRLPAHGLYALGYTSIGCAPCTRAVSAGEDVRAGRWWWEDGTVKECGLHARPVQRGAAAEAVS
ncbi:MAG: phosphoadenylyl-sulfate reductase [Burkholderiales bacterium]|nr:phosphoadenylyl-sulfate reductase [Burkholderiales bacterium]